MSIVLASSGASLSLAEAANCQFVLGFQKLHDLIPDVVGACQVNEYYNANGDAQQETTNGMMVWRKADNFTAFTDGYRTWVDGPYGVQTRLNTERFDWENASASAPAATAAQPESGAVGQAAPSDSAAPESGVSAEEATAPSDTSGAQPASGMDACTGNYHYVLESVNGGEVVVLMDGSLWRIQPVDKVNTMMWRPGEAITLTDDTSENADYPCYLANESDGSSANAKPAE